MIIWHIKQLSDQVHGLQSEWAKLKRKQSKTWSHEVNWAQYPELLGGGGEPS